MIKNINDVVTDYIMNYINDSSFQLSEPLPSENFLANKFKTSRSTVRHVLQKLNNRGIIFAKKGSGYFINPFFNFTKLHPVGLKNIDSTKILKTGIDNKNIYNIFDKLQAKKPENLWDYYGYVKVFYLRGKPIIFVKSYLSKKVFSYFDFQAIEDSLMKFIAAENIKPMYSINQTFISNCDELDEEIFKLTKSQKIVVNCALMFDENYQIIEICEKHTLIEYFNQESIKFF